MDVRSWGENLTEVHDDDEVMSHTGSSDDEDFQFQPDKIAEDEDVEISHGPSTKGENRRLRNEIFSAFAAQKIEEVTEEEVKEALQDADEEKLSIRDILAKQEMSAGITSPREYQTELFLKAKDENIIAVLDTGSGKTHIATLLLRHILDLELEARTKGGPNKTAFFLVNSVNLVFQQSNVLQCGLDHNVEGVCGAMGASLWLKPTWDGLFSQNMVVVCTAEVLVQCLMHSFISMSQINLLIFDEAHHAKSNHPYAVIIKDYYLHELNPANRPRIFGMTASPVDANVNVKDAAQELEYLLHSKIATTSDLALLANHVSRPSEEIVLYSRSKDPFETPFYRELKDRYGDISAFEKLFKDSKAISSELGRWASDAYWSFAFGEEKARKLEQREERAYNRTKRNNLAKLNAQISQFQEAADFVIKHDIGVPSPTQEDLSAKVLKLYEWLMLYYCRTGDARCIVFVERRATAHLLQMIFKAIGGPHLHTDILMGARASANLSDLRVSLRSQVLTVSAFRKGNVNCIFSTSVAEEGLDIPECNLVIRFDLYKTMIAYVQSRGRARHRNSKYLHFVEVDNQEHRALVYRAHSAESTMRQFCNGLSKDRLLDEPDDIVAKFQEKNHASRTDIDPITGAKLTYRSSLSVLAHYVATIPTPHREVDLQPTYVVDHQGGQFLAEVILPSCALVASVRGLPCRKKAMARCSAAFEMCLSLKDKGLLDKNLLPTTGRKVLPEMRNALLAISERKKDQYDMRIKPTFWDVGIGNVPKKLFMAVLDVDAGLDRAHQPIGLITRSMLPKLPSFPIYLGDGRSSNVLMAPLPRSFEPTEMILKQLTTLTLEVYKEIFAKEFEESIHNMTYWLVPLDAKLASSVSLDPEPLNLIDWHQVHEICEKGEYRWNQDMPDDFLADKYIVDPNDGGRRFYSIKVAPHLKATDPVPDAAPKHKYMKDILDYSISLWAKSRAKFEHAWDRSQPVVEVEKIPFRRNYLALVEKDEDDVVKLPTAFVCPQPLRISALTTPFVAMCYVFPAMIHRFESYLIALEACDTLSLKIGPRLALEAVTKDSENSEEHGETKINFKSGMGPNYERLEFMGDCFLKMATSISTFVLKPNENEFEFHVHRMCMLCNKNLFKTALKHKLYEYIRSAAFSRRTWYPEALKLLKGKGKNRVGPLALKHRLGDKSVADVCEALIGAAFMEYNEPGLWRPERWDEAVKAVTILVDSENHLMEKFSDYYAAYEKPTYQLAEATASQLDLAQKIEAKHPYHFKYPRLLRSAFLHPSQAFMWEQIPNYQRLEFLGDALLDQVFIMYLFYRFPNKDPQWLTEHKMPMVCNKFLGAVCVDLGFHRHIRQNSPILTSQIRNYVVELEEAREKTQNQMDYWNHTTSEPPKCLADVVEAFVAAMFVDSEFDFTVVQNFFDMHLKQYFEDISLYKDYASNHPVNRLQTLMTTNFGCRKWSTGSAPQKSIIPGVRDRTLVMVQIHYKVHFHASGDSYRYAMPRAVKAAIEKLEGLPRFEFRKLYGCDCEDDGKDEGVEGMENFEEEVREAAEKMDNANLDGDT